MLLDEFFVCFVEIWYAIIGICFERGAHELYCCSQAFCKVLDGYGCRFRVRIAWFAVVEFGFGVDDEKGGGCQCRFLYVVQVKAVVGF